MFIYFCEIAVNLQKNNYLYLFIMHIIAYYVNTL